jgi:hypothetical protein
MLADGASRRVAMVSDLSTLTALTSGIGAASALPMAITLARTSRVANFGERPADRSSSPGGSMCSDGKSPANRANRGSRTARRGTWLALERVNGRTHRSKVRTLLGRWLRGA